MLPPAPHDSVHWIRDAATLAAFRSSVLAVEPVLAALEAHGTLLQNHDPGAGKTSLIDRVLATLRETNRYDLILYLASERSVLMERPCVKETLSLPLSTRDSHDVAVLLGRPRERCGPLDAHWAEYEATGCTAIGRRQLCENCTEMETCGWPRQLTTAALVSKRVVCATQAYLKVVPGFVSLVADLVGAARVLVILDEAPLMEMSFKAQLDLRTIERWVAVFGDAARGASEEIDARAWDALHRRLLDPGDALTELERPPPLTPAMSEAIQTLGLRRYGRQFRFLGYEIALLTRCSRWRSGDGNIGYRRRPTLGGAHCLVTAAGLPLEVARRHLGLPDLVEYAPGIRFLHEGSEVFNLRSRLGAARNFSKNAPQILACFAELIAGRVASGFRCVAVTKKEFVESAGPALEAHLRRLSGRPFRVVHLPDRETCEDPYVVPLLHYGVRGVNTYEGFDTAVALNSYNARAEVLEELLNDPHRPGDDVRVEMTVRDGTRVAHTPSYWDQRQGFVPLAADYQQLVETVWAEQTLGRVRFSVRPRLVVFFQMGPVRFPAREFTTLRQLRQHFGLTTDRARAASQRRGAIQAMTSTGASVGEIAARLGVHPRTVFRHRRRG
ncbi:MAG: helix-turn-helix domain-containing protein [Myxococcaceae bacterium]|nr:MAG: helix-turn-helix domain-containing protein [Myxococcaceae bacterium]